MEKKKQKKKITKTKLKPIVIETKGDPTQAGNPLNKQKPGPPNYGVFEETLPEGFKTADKVTEKDTLEFENKKLRDLLMMWNFKLKYDGKWYYFLVDPLNQNLEMFDKDPTTGGFSVE